MKEEGRPRLFPAISFVLIASKKKAFLQRVYGEHKVRAEDILFSFFY